MSVTVARLRALAAVAAFGTFSAAARELGVSQAAVAQNVRDLERAYGVLLFERRHGVLEPTPACRDLADLAEQMRTIEEDARWILMRETALATGTVSIGLGNSMPGMALIAAFQRNYPSVTVSVELGSFEQIIRAVLTRRVDVGVLPDVPADGRFTRELLIEQDVVAIVDPSHPLADAELVRCADLAAHRLIFRGKGSSTQRAVDPAFRQAGLDVRPAMVLDTRDGVYEAVANSLGVGFMWRYGTGRTDAIRRVPVLEMHHWHQEVAFRLDEAPRPVVAAFMSAIPAFRAASALRSTP